MFSSRIIELLFFHHSDGRGIPELPGVDSRAAAEAPLAEADGEETPDRELGIHHSSRSEPQRKIRADTHRGRWETNRLLKQELKF